MAGFLLAYTLSTGDVKAQEYSDPVEKNVTVQVQMVKTDSSEFRPEEDIGFNAFGMRDSAVLSSVYLGTSSAGGVDANGFGEETYTILTQHLLTAVRDRRVLPVGYSLSLNYPEPVLSTGVTSTDVTVKNRQFVDVILYYILGEEVYRRDGVEFTQGKNITRFSGFENFTSGAYIKEFRFKDFSVFEKIMNVGGRKFTGGSSGLDFKVLGVVSPDAVSYSLQKNPDGTETFLGEDVFTQLRIDWVVPGFGADYVIRELWEPDSLTGEMVFQDTIYQKFDLPYPP